MSISLSKGGNLSLSKENPALNKILIGLGWDARSSDGHDFDLDASIFMVNDAGKVRGDHDFIFYNQLKSTCGSVTHTGDNRDGQGDGDDESLKVELALVPQEIKRLVAAVTIHDGERRKQNFGQVRNAFMRIVDEANGKEIARFDLSEDYSGETAMIFGEVYKHNNEWKFKAVGQGFNGGLGPLARSFGVDVG
jgi:tellurium resistance protein TerD